MDAPTYYRHRNEEDLKHEIVVRSFTPGMGVLWWFTVTSEDGIEPFVVVHVRTSEFAVYTALPGFFLALAEQRPGTLDGVARILDGLGVVDDTAGRERARARADAAWPDDDSWPYL